MKKIIIVVAAFLSYAAGAQAQKVGFVDTRKVLDTLPIKDTAEKKLEGLALKFKTDLATYEEELSNRQQEYQRESQTPGVSKIKLEMLENTYNSVLQAYQQEQEQMNKDLQTAENALVMPILKEIKTAVGIVAKQKGYTTVIDNSNDMVLFLGNTADDLTEAVIKYLLANPPKVTLQVPSNTTISTGGLKN